MTNLNAKKRRLFLAASFNVIAASAGFMAPASAADMAAPSVASQPNQSSKMIQSESPEGRIRHLHDQLKITPDQEAQWNPVAQVMLDNASAMNGAIKDREGMSSRMTAVDDLRSYQAIVEGHAEGIKKLATAFAPLYAAMPEAQQKNADAVFSRRTESPKLKKHA